MQFIQRISQPQRRTDSRANTTGNESTQLPELCRNSELGAVKRRINDKSNESSKSFQGPKGYQMMT